EERLEEIRELRLQKREALLAQQAVPYPSEARRTHTIAEIIATAETLIADVTPIVAVGRVMSIRSHGSVVFLDLKDASGQLQLQLTRDTVSSEMFDRLATTDAGDFIQAAGKLSTTTRGITTLLIGEFHIISKSIRPLPSTWFGLKDHETRYRHREVDVLLNPTTRETMAVRSHVTQELRTRLLKRGYSEVETPILQPLSGGATAAPFTTHHEALAMPLYLRIAPELYLKRLLVGGFEKVFEIGRNFRNEGIDREHNPEFTMLELYWAYADYEDLMDFTEEFLWEIVTAVKNEEVKQGDITLSFARPWQRQRFVEVVSKAIDFDILTDQNPATYIELFNERGLELPVVQTYSKLIDDLYKKLVRPTIIQPTLLYDYPIELAPLAKRSQTDPRLAEKFQLVVNGTEIVNAYSELNDPVEQRQRFVEQQEALLAGDKEAHQIDEAYLRALEYGMPPAAGWGLGVDRLVAILADAPTLRDTIAFPLLRPEA
ncbi:MAG: lysine--tRNA ligase, partial [Candidatus Andersenbacteria bacterium]